MALQHKLAQHTLARVKALGLNPRSRFTHEMALHIYIGAILALREVGHDEKEIHGLEMSTALLLTTRGWNQILEWANPLAQKRDQTPAPKAEPSTDAS